MDQYERNRQRIAKVGSAHIPPPERTPLGTVIELEPEWVCCCCDQEIPRPSGGFSVPVGSFCAACFVGLMEHLFNKTTPMFLNAVRDETTYFIRVRREDFENGLRPLPELKATTVMDVAGGYKERFKAKLRALICEMDEEDEARVPDGTPGVRDVDARCELFEPGTPAGTGECLGDGHYLCHECERMTPEDDDEDHG